MAQVSAVMVCVCGASHHHEHLLPFLGALLFCPRSENPILFLLNAPLLMSLFLPGNGNKKNGQNWKPRSLQDTGQATRTAQKTEEPDLRRKL